MSQERFFQLLSRKIAGEASIHELVELEKLLNEHDEWKRIAEQLLIDKPTTTGQDAHEADAAFEAHSVKMQLTGRLPAKVASIRGGRNLVKWTIRIAAVLTIAVAGIYLFNRIDKKNTKAVGSGEITTRKGSRTKAELPDGTQFWLNAESKLIWKENFGKEVREVSLTGEAFFEVVKNADKPFIIHTKTMDIKVLGTSFNIRAYSDEKFAEASLVRGSIEVTLKDRKDQKIILKPNEKISVANEKPKKETDPEIVLREIKPIPNSNIIGEIAWTQNKLYFEDKTLEDIGHLLERWFGKKVTIANESLKSIRFTGSFENETIDEVLSYLKSSKQFNFRIENNTVFIY